MPEKTPHGEDHGEPLVVHVIPSQRARGAQRAARVLVDRLNEQGAIHHFLLALFDGPAEVPVDLVLEGGRGSGAAEGLDPRVALRLRSALGKLNTAAVVAHGGDAMKYALPATFGSGLPLVYCVIGTYAGSASKFHECLWRLIMARADRVIAVGEEVLEECIKRFRVAPNRAMVIPNGRDPSEFHPRSGPPRASGATLIFVGALTTQKQPDRFVEVVRRLRAQGRTIRAVMVGDGPLAPTLAVAAREQRIELLGARQDVPELLRGADVFLFTSLPTGEGMPGVLIEAGLSGLPVVSTPVPGAATVLVNGRTGMIVEDSATSLAAAVGELLDSPDRRTAMGVSARDRCASEFNLDRMARRWGELLQPMISVQMGTARPGVRTSVRRANASLRATLSRRHSSHT